MLTLLLNLLLSTWLFVSSFVLAHSVVTAWNSLIVACLIAAVSFVAFSVPGRPGMRWVNAVLAVYLFVSALILPHESLGTILHDVAVSMALAAISFFPPAGWLRHWRDEHGHHGGHAPPTGT